MTLSDMYITCFDTICAPCSAGHSFLGGHHSPGVSSQLGNGFFNKASDPSFIMANDDVDDYGAFSVSPRDRSEITETPWTQRLDLSEQE